MRGAASAGALSVGCLMMAPMAGIGRDEHDAAVVQRSLRALGRHAPSGALKRLDGGASGSRVFLLERAGDVAVLKVTEDPAWRAQAVRELAVYRAFAAALDGFLPTLHAAQRDREGVRLLLSAHPPHPPASMVTGEAWVRLAAQLGRLHRVAAARPAWLGDRPSPSPAQIAEAVRIWQDRGGGPLARRAARRLAAAGRLEAALGKVLTHGDCHLGNLLQSADGRAVWIDWQEACLGSGLEDLVFLWQRAEFDGAHPPRGAMTAAYAAQRAVRDDPGFRSALAASELRLLLVAWPPFLAYGSADGARRMTSRLQQLVDGDASEGS